MSFVFYKNMVMTLNTVLFAFFLLLHDVRPFMASRERPASLVFRDFLVIHDIPWVPVGNTEMASCLLQLQTILQSTSLCTWFCVQEPVYQRDQFLEVESWAKISLLKMFD